MKMRNIILIILCVIANSLFSQNDTIKYDDGDFIQPNNLSYHGDSACLAEKIEPGSYFDNSLALFQSLGGKYYISDIMQPYISESQNLKIKGMAVYMYCQRGLYNDTIYDPKTDSIKLKLKSYWPYDSLNMNFYVGISNADSQIIQTAKLEMNLGTSNPNSTYVEKIGYAYFNQTVEISSGELFYAIFESPKPNNDSIKYNWNFERYKKFGKDMLLKCYTRYDYPYIYHFGKTKQKPPKHSDYYEYDTDTLGCYFTYMKIFDLDATTGTLDSDTNWQIVGTGKASPTNIKFNMLFATPVTTFLMFPIFGEVQPDTIIKGGYSCTGNTSISYDSILKGDTTIIQYTYITCDTTVNPDTIIQSKTGDTIMNILHGDTIVTCDTTLTYDTVIKSSIKEAESSNHNMFTFLQPNPANKTVTILSSFEMNLIELYTQDGKKLYKFKTPPTHIVEALDISTYPTGVYLIVIHTPNSKITKKLIIK